ncbi:RTA1 like protein-domain-containing protein [Chytriomyces sp. MP71]|nr:RTA1 like protein-domain-containing protein [Chytriomyces sp. MP71]
MNASMDFSEKLPDGSWNYAVTGFVTKPNQWLAIGSGAVFAVLLLAHIVLAIRHRTSYMIGLIIGCLMEVLGFAARYLSIHDPFNIPKFATQLILILLAPIFISGTQYVLLEKVMHFTYPAASPIKHTLVGKLFVFSDVVTFAVQIYGAGLLSDAAKVEQGKPVMLWGLGIQLVSFAAFIWLAILFYIRANREEARAGSFTRSLVNPKWRRVFVALLWSALAVLVRSIFRLAEFAEGADGPILKNEYYMYGFDCAMMLIASAAFAVAHPGPALVQEAGLLGNDGKSVANAEYVPMH